MSATNRKIVAHFHLCLHVKYTERIKASCLYFFLQMQKNVFFKEKVYRDPLHGDLMCDAVILPRQISDCREFVAGRTSYGGGVFTMIAPTASSSLPCCPKNPPS